MSEDFSNGEGKDYKFPDLNALRDGQQAEGMTPAVPLSEPEQDDEDVPAGPDLSRIREAATSMDAQSKGVWVDDIGRVHIDGQDELPEVAQEVAIVDEPLDEEDGPPKYDSPEARQKALDRRRMLAEQIRKGEFGQ